MSENVVENRNRYQNFWHWYSIDNPKKWPQWKILEPYISSGAKILEVGSGLRPKIPINGGFFLDIDVNSLNKLKRAGANSVESDLKGVPFARNSFDVVCAFEVLEHLENDEEVMRDLAQVLKQDGKILVSFPLHQKLFNDYDKTAGHMRRYEVSEVEHFFSKAGLQIDQFSGIDVPWPTSEEAKKLVYLENHVPWLIPMTTKIIDSLPFTSVRKPISLKKWNTNLAQEELAKVSTGFFVLKK